MDRQGGRKKVWKMMGEDERWCIVLITQMWMISGICATFNGGIEAQRWYTGDYKDINPLSQVKNIFYTSNTVFFLPFCGETTSNRQRQNVKSSNSLFGSLSILAKFNCQNNQHRNRYSEKTDRCEGTKSDQGTYVIRKMWFIVPLPLWSACFYLGTGKRPPPCVKKERCMT